MTLVASWIRSVGQARELVMASDSRLRFGCAWDCAPKVLRLPRGDCAIGFAGDTMHTYPLMLQLISAVENYHKARSRALDLHDLKGHALRVFGHMREYIHDLPQGDIEPEAPDAQFILGGYSWLKQDFRIWLISYDAHSKQFKFTRTRRWPGNQGEKVFRFAGDGVREAKDRLQAILRDTGKTNRGGLDMEPFQVLRDMIRDRGHPLIGGPPQIVKVYKHMNCVPYAVYWPNRDHGQLTMLGRPLLDYERTQHLALDPDTLETFKTWEYIDPEEQQVNA